MNKTSALFAWIVMASMVVYSTITCSSENTGEVILRNSTSQTIAHATIEICNQTIEIDNIKPHKDYRNTFRIRSDSHYKVIVSFPSGKKMRKELGYVTQGFDFSHIITVSDSGISISYTKIE